MKDGPDIAAVASLIGDPARANMLSALMSGKALTVSELAAEAGVSLPTASAHLAKLSDGGLITFRKQGRHRYAAIADDAVGAAIESLMGLAARQGKLRTRTGPRDPAMRQARVCYRHLAGERGVRMFDSLKSRGAFAVAAGENEDDLTLTSAGREIVTAFGVDLAPLEKKRTPLCRACLDWSARRSHLAGSLGAALLSEILDKGWAERAPDSRVVAFTTVGAKSFDAAFPV